MESKESSITRSAEEYLENILFLSKRNPHVRITDIASEMGISKPSAHKAVQSLKSQGFVEHERYSSITLTAKGKTIAEGVLKRHIVLKDFLTYIGVDTKTADEEACAIEHSISLNTIEKLSSYLQKERANSNNL